MKFETLKEAELFEQLVNEFVEKHGQEPLKDIYLLAKTFRKELDICNFPATQVYYHLLAQNMETVYSNKTLPEIAEAEGMKKRTIYNFYHKFYTPWKRRKRKKK